MLVARVRLREGRMLWRRPEPSFAVAVFLLRVAPHSVVYAMAFVDDYSGWVTGPTAEDNTRKIQERIISRAEAWEAMSGATFEPHKTTLVHFSRKSRKLSDDPLVIRDQQV